MSSPNSKQDTWRHHLAHEGCGRATQSRNHAKHPAVRSALHETNCRRTIAPFTGTGRDADDTP